MKVWVVEYDNVFIVEIFKSRESAEAFISKFEDDYDYSLYIINEWDVSE